MSTIAVRKCPVLGAVSILVTIIPAVFLHDESPPVSMTMETPRLHLPFNDLSDAPMHLSVSCI